MSPTKKRCRFMSRIMRVEIYIWVLMVWSAQAPEESSRRQHVGCKIVSFTFCIFYSDEINSRNANYLFFAPQCHVSGKINNLYDVQKSYTCVYENFCFRANYSTCLPECWGNNPNTKLFTMEIALRSGRLDGEE